MTDKLRAAAPDTPEMKALAAFLAASFESGLSGPAMREAAIFSLGLPAQPQQPLSNETALRFAGWFREIPSAMSHRLWEQGGHTPEQGDVALYEGIETQQPLSDDQMWDLWHARGIDDMNQQEAIAFARAIEAAHGILPTTNFGKGERNDITT